MTPQKLNLLNCFPRISVLKTSYFLHLTSFLTVKRRSSDGRNLQRQLISFIMAFSMVHSVDSTPPATISSRLYRNLEFIENMEIGGANLRPHTINSGA